MYTITGFLYTSSVKYLQENDSYYLFIKTIWSNRDKNSGALNISDYMCLTYSIIIVFICSASRVTINEKKTYHYNKGNMDFPSVTRNIFINYPECMWYSTAVSVQYLSCSDAKSIPHLTSFSNFLSVTCCGVQNFWTLYPVFHEIKERKKMIFDIEPFPIFLLPRCTWSLQMGL